MQRTIVFSGHFSVTLKNGQKRKMATSGKLSKRVGNAIFCWLKHVAIFAFLAIFALPGPFLTLSIFAKLATFAKFHQNLNVPGSNMTGNQQSRHSKITGHQS